MLVHGEMNFDALDLLAAIEAAAQATRRRRTGSAIDDDGAGSAGFGPDRVGREPFAAITASSARTSSPNASTSLKASHDARDVFAVRTAVPICCWARRLLMTAADIAHCPPACNLLFRLK
jgi:hypothetical protein